jgi:branched-subunit amino acid ABC-type transport system permease component
MNKILGLSPYLGFPIAFFIGGLFSVPIYKVVIEALQKVGGGTIVLTIGTLAIQIFLTALIQVYAFWLREKYHTYAMNFLLKEADFTLAGFPGIFIVSMTLSIGSVIALRYLLTKTRMGVAMRATSEDPELASVLGINTEKIQVFSWFLTGGLACLAGAMIPMWFMSTPQTGAGLITSIMAGSLLGGFSKIYVAVIGGATVGISEIILTFCGQSFIGTWIGEYRPLVSMAFLVAVLLFEPEGLEGVWRRIKPQT